MRRECAAPFPCRHEPCLIEVALGHIVVRRARRALRRWLAVWRHQSRERGLVGSGRGASHNDGDTPCQHADRERRDPPGGGGRPRQLGRGGSAQRTGVLDAQPSRDTAIVVVMSALQVDQCVACRVVLKTDAALVCIQLDLHWRAPLKPADVRVVEWRILGFFVASTLLVCEKCFHGVIQAAAGRWTPGVGPHQQRELID